MGYDLKINGEVVHTYDIDPRMVESVVINGSYRVPVAGGGNSASLDVQVIPISPRDYGYLASVRNDAFGEAEKEIESQMTPQENPTAVALEKEFGAQPSGQILPTESELRGSETTDKPEGSVGYAEAAGDDAAVEAMQSSVDADETQDEELTGSDEAPIQAFESEEVPTTTQEDFVGIAEDNGPDA